MSRRKRTRFIGHLDWLFAPPETMVESAPVKDTRWLPISTAPTTGRQKLLLKTPYAPDGVIAFSNTWWVGGSSVECKATHWMPLPEEP